MVNERQYLRKAMAGFCQGTVKFATQGRLRTTSSQFIISPRTRLPEISRIEKKLVKTRINNLNINSNLTQMEKKYLFWMENQSKQKRIAPSSVLSSSYSIYLLD